MIRRSFYLNPIILLSSLITGFVAMFNWSSRHPYLVFFQSKFLMIFRYAVAMGAFYLIFTLLRAFIRYLTIHASETAKRLFFQTDLITYLMLGPLLFKRYFIPGRREGNLYYLAIFSGWFVLKIVLMLIFFDRSVWAQFPSKCLSLLKKSPIIWKKLFEKNEYKVTYFALILLYCASLQILFSRSLPSVSIWIPLSYSLFFFFGLLFVHALFKTLLPKAFYSLIIYSSFLLCVLTTLDYLSFQVVNLHMNGSLGALVADGFKEIPKVLEGADVKMSYFIGSVLLTLLLPVIGVLGHKYLPSKKVSFSLLTPLLLASISLGVCFKTDHSIEKKLPVFATQSINKTYPIYPFFLKTQGERFNFEGSLTPPPSEEEFQTALNNADAKASTKPHVFVFVVESFREDYINQKTAPFLTELKKEAPQFELTASNSNVTHISLFTIYNGLFPHHWITLRDGDYSKGSFPLQLLKKSGYKLDALHSSFFKYFNIGEVLFGKDYHLLDTLYEARELSPDVAHRDRIVLDKAKEMVSTFKEDSPHYMTILLDSTHHHYYWPEELEVPYKPYLKAFNYTNKGKEQLALTKNRYRNSIFYVDQLLKEFCDHLKKEGLYDSSLILITGDHGEEFQEHGHYFHGTDLCLPQSHVPLLYKFPKDLKREPKQKLTSHIDFFPSLFDFMGLSYPKELLPGNSIFSSEEAFILSFRPQYKKNPYQFYLHNGKEKIEAKFTNSEEIYKSKGIELMALKNRNEKVISFKKEGEMEAHVHKRFNQPLKNLFLAK